MFPLPDHQIQMGRYLPHLTCFLCLFKSRTLICFPPLWPSGPAVEPLPPAATLLEKRGSWRVLSYVSMCVNIQLSDTLKIKKKTILNLQNGCKVPQQVSAIYWRDEPHYSKYIQVLTDMSGVHLIGI